MAEARAVKFRTKEIQWEVGCNGYSQRVTVLHSSLLTLFPVVIMTAETANCFLQTCLYILVIKYIKEHMNMTAKTDFRFRNRLPYINNHKFSHIKEKLYMFTPRTRSESGSANHRPSIDGKE